MMVRRHRQPEGDIYWVSGSRVSHDVREAGPGQRHPPPPPRLPLRSCSPLLTLSEHLWLQGPPAKADSWSSRTEGGF